MAHCINSKTRKTFGDATKLTGETTEDVDKEVELEDKALADK